METDVEYHMEMIEALGEEGSKTTTFVSLLHEELAFYGNMSKVGVKISML